MTTQPITVENPQEAIEIVKSMEKCWLCLRVKPQEIFRYTHQIWTDRKIAHKIGKEAVKIISKSYAEKPTFWCGKNRRTIISGLLYILGMANNEPIQQRILETILNISQPTIMHSYHAWLETFPHLFPEDIEERFEKWGVKALFGRGL